MAEREGTAALAEQIELAARPSKNGRNGCGQALTSPERTISTTLRLPVLLKPRTTQTNRGPAPPDPKHSCAFGGKGGNRTLDPGIMSAVL